jgi:NADPH:quinone reductase-like Zn-dependent oxidoreductase
MKAVICPKYGPPEVLRIVEFDKPVPSEKEVLVKVKTTAVTVADSRIRGLIVPPSFKIPFLFMMGFKGPKNQIRGSVFAGEVEKVGSQVTKYKPGDRVLGILGHEAGAHAEYLCISEEEAVQPLPDPISFADGTAILWGGLTSNHFLKKARIQPQQKVLVYGASGSVGSAGVQLACYYGAQVTGVCSNENEEFVRALGAKHVINYKTDDFSEKIDYYDIIYDTVGKTDISKAIRSLKLNGTYIHTVATPAVSIKAKWKLLGTKKRFIGGSFKPNKEMIRDLVNLTILKHMKPVIDRTYPLDEIIEAHRYVDTGHKKGDVIITI